MTPQEFRDWRERMEWSQQRAADALGLGKVAVQDYERGHTAGRDPKPRPVPQTVALACVALRLGYSGYEVVEEKPRR